MKSRVYREITNDRGVEMRVYAKDNRWEDILKEMKSKIKNFTVSDSYALSMGNPFSTDCVIYKENNIDLYSHDRQKRNVHDEGVL